MGNPKEARRKKDLYVHRPWLDHLFTVLFVGLVGFVVLTISKEPTQEGSLPPWIQFLLLLLVVAAVVSGVKKLSAWLATILNTALMQAKLVDKPPLKGKVQLKKWQDQFWQLVVHVTMTTFEVYALSTDLSGMWTDMSLAWTPAPWIWKPTPLVRWLYWTQLAIWIYTCFIHRFSMERIKDYFMMYLHHLLTIGLIAASYYENYIKIGVLVLLIHDASDIGVDMLKLVNYTKLRGRKGWFGSELAFAGNLIAWFYFRIYVYPTSVIYSSLVQSIQVLSKREFEGEPSSWLLTACKYFISPESVGLGYLPLYRGTNAMLILLQVLHVIWTHLFLRILWRIATESSGDASRKEYEGGSESDEDEDVDESSGTPASKTPKPKAE